MICYSRSAFDLFSMIFEVYETFKEFELSDKHDQAHLLKSIQNTIILYVESLKEKYRGSLEIGATEGEHKSKRRSKLFIPAFLLLSSSPIKEKLHTVLVVALTEGSGTWINCYKLIQKRKQIVQIIIELS